MFIRPLLRVLGHQQWLRFGLRDRIIRAFHHPDTSKPEKFTVPFFGKRYTGDFSTFLDWSVYYYGAYCLEELTIMKDCLKGIKDPIVLDIGANIGHHSLFAATLAKEVHSFEPYGRVAEKLQQKIQQNALSNIHLHAVGLGDVATELYYHQPMGANTGTGTFIDNELSDSDSLKLPILRGDDFIPSLNLPKLDFIKMDIEGFEPYALRGLQQTLKKYNPIVFFEWTANDEFTDAEPLFPANYTLFNFIVPSPKLVFFSDGVYKLTKANVSNTNGYGYKLAVPIDKLAIISDKISED